MIGLELLFSVHSKQLKSKDDALIVAIHCYLVNNGFRCTGTGSQESYNDQESEQLPSGWNANNGSYVLRYKKTGREEKKLLLKVLSVDNNALVNVLQTPGDMTATVDLPIDTYLTDNFADYNSVFVDQSSVNKLEQMLQKMMTDLKPQKLESSPKHTSKRAEPRYDPVMEPRYTYPPMTDPRSSLPSRNPYLPSLGGADLNPFHGEGGMILDPRGFPSYQHRRPQSDPYGLPRGAVPPGARFDPFGPPMPRRPGPDRNRGRGRGRYANPDPDGIPRPDDYDDMFM